jgi:5-(carboxyamino)imidazole ribonucleotide synthase
MSPVVGVIGGGQLARMMIPAAINLGIDLHVLAENEGESAAIAVSTLGDYRKVDDVLRFSEGVDVITFDHEHVPQDVLAALVDAGVAVRPGPTALAVAQDKLLMREKLTALGVPTPDWARVQNKKDLGDFIDAHGGAAVLKTPRGGYDGHGVRVVRDANAGDDWFADRGALLVEELVPFRRELAQLVARRPSGQLVAWPVVETVQANGVCAEVFAPAPSPAPHLAAVAEEIARQIAESLDVTGVLAVELFETDDERIVVNELAMRPHNSGHWTMDGAVTSQFEQHLRAVLDLPLGDAAAREAWTVMINILGGPTAGSLVDRYPSAFEAQPGVKYHNYGKAPRPGRKVGHVNAVGADLDDVTYRARAAAGYFTD